TPVQVRDEIRQQNRMAELFYGHSRRLGNQDRPQTVRGTHRISLREVRRASGPRVRGRTRTDGSALLQQRRRAEVHSRLRWRMTTFSRKHMLWEKSLSEG